MFVYKIYLWLKREKRETKITYNFAVRDACFADSPFFGEGLTNRSVVVFSLLSSSPSFPTQLFRTLKHAMDFSVFITTGHIFHISPLFPPPPPHPLPIPYFRRRVPTSNFREFSSIHRTKTFINTLVINDASDRAARTCQ